MSCLWRKSWYIPELEMGKGRMYNCAWERGSLYRMILRCAVEAGWVDGR